jgi:hypothetical protein
MDIWYNLRPFGIVCGHLVYFSLLGRIKIWQPCSQQKYILSKKVEKSVSKSLQLLKARVYLQSTALLTMASSYFAASSSLASFKQKYFLLL